LIFYAEACVFTFISIVFIIFSLFAHEFWGHASSMRESGVHVNKIALGLPYGPQVTFPLKGKWLGTDFVIHYLCPLGAFTEYSEQEMKSLPFWQQSRIHASGPMVSLMFGYFFIVLAGFIAIAERPEINIWYFPHLPFLMVSLISIAILGLLLRFGGKNFFTYIMPIVPVALLLFVIGSFFLPGTSVASPVALVSSAGRIAELSGSFFFAGNASIIYFGLPMLLPLRLFGIALDGEQIIRPIIERCVPRVLPIIESAGTMAFGLLILYVLQKDLAPIFLPFIRKLLS